MVLSFAVVDLLPKNLLINLLPPCFMVAVPEIEDDFEETLGRSLTSLTVIGAIAPNMSPKAQLPTVHFEELGLVA